MSDWIRCEGLPEDATYPVDISFFEDRNKVWYNLNKGDVGHPRAVMWWRPAEAAPSATLPAAESPREVSGMEPDDAEPSREPSTVPHTQQRARPLDAQEAFGLADEVKIVGKFENANADEAASVPLTGPEYGEALRRATMPAFTLADSPAEKYFAISDTLQVRRARYGDFTDNAEISQALKQCMGNQMGWGNLNAVQREALEMIVQKVARILNGDPNYRDNWHDIQGYARLAEERCRD